MGIMTKDQYYKSLENTHHTAYILGEKVENVHEHPLISHMTASVAKTYELQNDPEGRTCYGRHYSMLCQYEIHKAIDTIEKGRLFSHARLK